MKLIASFVILACSLIAADRKFVWDSDKAELSWTSTTDNKTKYVINYRTRLMTS